MKFWSREELHEIEEELLSRKETLVNLPEKYLKKIVWTYEDWESDVIEQGAAFGCTIDALGKFLHRTQSDILHYVRGLGHENWLSYCEVIQGVESRKDLTRTPKASYRDIVEAMIGRPLTKEEHVHHINCDHHDDAAENLWICKHANHKHAHASYRRLQKALIANGVVVFDFNTGNYEFNPDAVDTFMDYWMEDTGTD